MNVFNRVVLVILLIVLLAITLLSLLVPQTVLEIVRVTVDQIEDAIPFYNIFSGLYWAYLGIGLAVVLLCLLLLWMELRPPRYRSVQVLGTDARRTEVGVKSITQRLQSDLSKLADVNRVKAKVTSRGKKVDTTLDVQVHPAVDVPSKTEEITHVVREVVEQGMGVKLGKVRVNLQFGADGPRVLPEPEPLPAYEPEPALEPVLPIGPAVEPEQELPEVIELEPGIEPAISDGEPDIWLEDEPQDLSELDPVESLVGEIVEDADALSDAIGDELAEAEVTEDEIIEDLIIDADDDRLGEGI